MSEDLMKRYKAVLNRLGHAALLELPEDMKDVLKRTTDLETKVKMFMRNFYGKSAKTRSKPSFFGGEYRRVLGAYKGVLEHQRGRTEGFGGSRGAF